MSSKSTSPRIVREKRRPDGTQRQNNRSKIDQRMSPQGLALPVRTRARKIRIFLLFLGH